MSDDLSVSKDVKASKLGDYFPYKAIHANYLINCSMRHKFIYVETPKVACSTIKRALQLIELDGDLTKLPRAVHDRKLSPLADPTNMPVSADRLLTGDDFFRFGFVRSPYTRTLSCYIDKVLNKDAGGFFLRQLGCDPGADLSLEKFLSIIRDQADIDKDPHWAPQSYLLQISKVDYHFMGRFERIDRDLRVLFGHLRPDLRQAALGSKMDEHATHAGDKVRQFIGRRERDLIVEIYEKDFSDLSYSRNLGLRKLIEGIRWRKRPQRGIKLG